MKKILFLVFLAVMIVLLLSSIALAAAPEEKPDIGNVPAAVELDAAADEGYGGVGADMNDGFYTWAILGTYAGCLAATLVVTQFVKPIWPQKIAVEFLSYIIALLILLLASIFIGGLTLERAGISVLNAVVVALAANGGYNGIKKISVKSTS